MYIYYGGGACYSIGQKKLHIYIKKEKYGCCIIACIISFLITLANIDLPYTIPVVILPVIFMGGCIVSFEVVSWFLYLYNKISFIEIYRHKKVMTYFWAPFIINSMVDLLYLYLVAYPGNLTTDSLKQISQINSGIYSNHHPFWHTMVIRVFYNLGEAIFKDVNAAVATYSVFQILTMASIFSYAIMTLYEIGVKWKIVLCVTAIYILMPYNIIYSCTMWKDVLFGGVCLLMIVSLYRFRHHIGKRFVSILIFGFSSIAVCILRSNGIYAYIFWGITLICVMVRREKKLIFIALISLMIALILKGPILNFLNVSQPDTTEKLSIPLQQIARVIYDKGDLSETDLIYISTIFDISDVKELYKNYISDPVKNIVRKHGGEKIINTDIWEFIKRWISIGIKNPEQYIRAWVDQTKGYWNAGYLYWVTYNSIEQRNNNLGIFRVTKNVWLSDKIDALMEFIEYSNTFLGIIVATGLYTWIYIILIGLNIINDNENYLEPILSLGIVVSLMLGTPVFNEFRYAYGLYTMIPFASITALCKCKYS